MIWALRSPRLPCSSLSSPVASPPSPALSPTALPPCSNRRRARNNPHTTPGDVRLACSMMSPRKMKTTKKQTKTTRKKTKRNTNARPCLILQQFSHKQHNHRCTGVCVFFFLFFSLFFPFLFCLVFRFNLLFFLHSLSLLFTLFPPLLEKRKPQSSKPRQFCSVKRSSGVSSISHSKCDTFLSSSSSSCSSSPTTVSETTAVGLANLRRSVRLPVYLPS